MNSPTLSVRNFTWNMIKYSSVSFADCFPGLFCFYIFSKVKQEKLIGVASLLRAIYVIFFGWCYNFFEPVNTLCLPYLAKNNLPLYSTKVWKLVMFNLLFFLTAFLGWATLKRALLSVPMHWSPEMLMSLHFSQEFHFLAGAFAITGKFLRGNFNPRSGLQYQTRRYFPLDVSDFLCGVFNYYLLFRSASSSRNPNIYIWNMLTKSFSNFDSIGHPQTELSLWKSDFPRTQSPLQ